MKKAAQTAIDSGKQRKAGGGYVSGTALPSFRRDYDDERLMTDGSTKRNGKVVISAGAEDCQFTKRRGDKKRKEKGKKETKKERQGPEPRGLKNDVGNHSPKKQTASLSATNLSACFTLGLNFESTAHCRPELKNRNVTKYKKRKGKREERNLGL